MNKNILKRLKNYDPTTYSLLTPKDRQAALELEVALEDAFKTAWTEWTEWTKSLPDDPEITMQTLLDAEFEHMRRANEIAAAVGDARIAEASAYIKRYGDYPDETIQRMADYADAFVMDTRSRVEREGKDAKTSTQLTTVWISSRLVHAWYPIIVAIEENGYPDFGKRATEAMDKAVAKRLGKPATKTPVKKGKGAASLGIFENALDLTKVFTNNDLRAMMLMQGRPDTVAPSPAGQIGIFRRGDTELHVTGTPRKPIKDLASESIPPLEMPTLGPTDTLFLILILGLLPTQNAYRGVTPKTANPVIDISVSEYMELRGLKDRKHVRAELLKNAENLKNATVRVSAKAYVAPKGKKKSVEVPPPRGFVSIVSDAYYLPNNPDTLRLVLGQTFTAWAANSFMIQFPNRFFLKADLHKFPNFPSLLFQVSNQLNMEARSHDGSAYVVLSSTTLAAYCPHIPDEKSMSPKQRNEKNRTIWGPLEKTLDALAPYMTWEFCNKGGEPLTEEQLKQPQTWKNIQNWYIKLIVQPPYIRVCDT